MKGKFVFLMFFLVFLLFVVSACSSNKVVIDNNTNAIDTQNNDFNNVDTNSNNMNDNTNANMNADSNVNENSNILKYCRSTIDNDVKYEYYISENKVLKRAESKTDKGIGVAEELLDNIEHKKCARSFMLGETKGWTCFDLTEQEFYDYMNMIKQSTEGAAAMIFKFECENIPYEEKYFEK